MIFCPRKCTIPGVMIVSGLARKPYPRGRGDTGLRSTSSSLRV